MYYDFVPWKRIRRNPAGKEFIRATRDAKVSVIPVLFLDVEQRLDAGPGLLAGLVELGGAVLVARVPVTLQLLRLRLEQGGYLAGLLHQLLIVTVNVLFSELGELLLDGRRQTHDSSQHLLCLGHF